MSSRRPAWGVLFGLLPLLVVAGTGAWLAWFSLSPADPAQSMAELERTVILGQFIRSLHRWAGYGTLVSVAVWSLRRWRQGRLGAVGGALLPTLLLAELISGLLLPWDQLSLWVLQRRNPGLPSFGDPATLEILWWYGLHLVLLPLVGVGVALAARRRTRQDSLHPMDR